MEIHPPISEIPKSSLTILNQLYELEQKLKKPAVPTAPPDLSRNINKMKDVFSEEGVPTWDGGGQRHIRLTYEDPMGQQFTETRTDLEATISGSGTENLVVVEVIKPIIRAILGDGLFKVVQNGIVIVESRKEQ